VVRVAVGDEEELLNAAVMTALQQNLLAAARGLRDHLGLADRSTRTWEILLESYRQALNNWKVHYILRESLFLDKDLVARSLDDSTDRDALLNVVSATNLVILMDALFAVGGSQDSDDILSLLQTLDKQFPWCIMTPQSVLSQRYQEYNTFDRALDIRTQRWIYEILAERSLDGTTALEIGADVFLASAPGEARKFDTLDLDDGELLPIFDVDFSQDPDMEEEEDQREARKKVADRVDELWQCMQGAEVDIDDLQRTFPIDRFFDDLSEWADNLFRSVIDTIESVPVRELQNEELVSSAVEAQIQQETDDRADPRCVPWRRSLDVHLYGPTNRYFHSTLHTGVASVGALFSASRGTRATIGEAVPSRDRHVSIEAPAAAVPSKKRSRRQYEDEDEDARLPTIDDRDEDYVPDEVPTEALEEPEEVPPQCTYKTPKRRPPRAKSSRATEEPREATGNPSASASEIQAEIRAATPAATGRRPPEQSIVVRAGTELLEDVQPAVRQPRRRIFWTKEDTEAVIELIREHGSYWAHMEDKARREKLFAVRRTQQQIRDKARNIKVDILRYAIRPLPFFSRPFSTFSSSESTNVVIFSCIRNDGVLPNNFDAVLLSAKDRNLLIRCGKNPDRKEEDVEDDGNPLNTEWED